MVIRYLPDSCDSFSGINWLMSVDRPINPKFWLKYLHLVRTVCVVHVIVGPREDARFWNSKYSPGDQGAFSISHFLNLIATQTVESCNQWFGESMPSVGLRQRFFFLTLFPSSVRGNRLPFLFDSVLRVLFLLSIGRSDWFSEKVACVSSTHRSKHHHGKESSLLERRFLDPRSAEERLWTMPSALKREKVSCLSRGHSWSQRFEIGC